MKCDGVYNEYNLVLENGVFTMKKKCNIHGYCLLLYVDFKS